MRLPVRQRIRNSLRDIPDLRVLRTHCTSRRGPRRESARERIEMRSVRRVAPGALGAILLLAARPACSDITERASMDSTGALTNVINIERFCPTLSADGRFVAFGSDATNLVPGDTNGVSDAFVHDRMTGTTERVSVSSARAEANGTSYAPAISADGRFVAFSSDATNLVGRDTNGAADVFIHDRMTGTTKRVSVSSTGAQANDDSVSGFAPTISADGRFVAFSSDS